MCDLVERTKKLIVANCRLFGNLCDGMNHGITFNPNIRSSLEIY